MKAFKRVILSLCFGCIGLGLILVIIGIACGGTANGKWRERYLGERGNYTSAYTGVESIEMDIDWGRVRIEEGTEFAVRGEQIYTEKFTSEVNDGIWKIHYSLGKRGGWMANFNFSPWGISKDDYDESVITVTLPSGCELNEFTMKMGAGDTFAENINAGKVSVDIGAGRAVINEINGKDSAKLKVGAGELVADQISTQDINLNCGAGRISLKGKVDQYGSITCGLGEIVMDLVGNPDDFGYKIDVGLGHVSVNGETYNGFVNLESGHKDGRNFDIHCGVGHVALTIN